MIQKLIYIIQYDNKNYALKHAPEEWDDSSIVWKRSKTYYGMSREFAFPLEFVKDGATMLRSIFYKKGIEAKAKLIVYRHQNLTVGYTDIANFDFDFSTLIDHTDSVEISLTDYNIESDIKSRENLTYEFDLSKATQKISMPEVPKIETEKGILLSQPWQVKYLVPTFSFVSSGDINPNILRTIDTDELATTNWNNIIAPANNGYVLESFSNKTIHVSLDLMIRNIWEDWPTPEVYFGAFDDQATGEDDSIVRQVITQNGRFEFEFDLSIEPGRKYIFMFFADRRAYDHMPAVDGDMSTVEISVSNPTEQLTAYVYPADEVFNMLMEKMTGHKPEYRNPTLARIKLTSGDGLRNIREAKLKTNFKDFFKSIHSVTGLCFGVEDGKPILQPYEYFFNKSLKIMDLGNVTEVSISPATDFMHSSIKVGYKDQNYEEELGRDEYNTEQQYSTGLRRSSSTLDLVSVYRADHLGIRKIRLDLERANDTDEDRSPDNDIFMIYTSPFVTLDSNTYRAITADNFEEVTGLLGRKDAINISISPKRNLLAHESFLKGALINTGAIAFESAKKDVAMTSRNSAGLVVERRNVYLSELYNPLFLPHTAKINAPVSPSQIKILKERQNGYVTFRHRGILVSGFLMEISTNIAYDDATEITLLLTPNNNLENLIM